MKQKTLLFLFFLILPMSYASVLEVGINSKNLKIDYADLTTGFPQDDLGGDYQLKLLNNNITLYTRNFSIPYSTESNALPAEDTDIIIKLPYISDVTNIEIAGHDNIQFLPEISIASIQLQENCQLIKYNGPTDKKLDITFVSDNFTNMQEFKDHVLKIIDFPSTYDGLLSIEPIKSNQHKFNFYYVNTSYTDLVWQVSPNVYQYSLSNIVNAASPCPYDKVVVVTKDNINSMAQVGGTAAIINYYQTLGNGIALTHEFGHLFAGLADEYIYSYASVPYNHYYSGSLLPNVDFANKTSACPKWCSGPPIDPDVIKQYDCSVWNSNEQPCGNIGGSYVNLFDYCTQITTQTECNSHGTYPNANCIWLPTKDPYFDSNCIPIKAAYSVNIGTGCINQTGCYAYGSYAGWYKSVPESMMNNNIVYWGPINYEIIENKFEIYPDNVTIHLKTGWNMFSFPRKPINNSVNYLFNQTNVTVYSYVDGKFNQVSYINESLGYWVKLNQDLNISYYGYKYTEDLNFTGTRLISYSEITPSSFASYFASNMPSSAFTYSNNYWSTYKLGKLNSIVNLTPDQALIVSYP